ncbi:MAG: EVE domain-containing protein [Armatimonadetes bacterium]|nr:EVE domain-containing protein [Armatimonadota bacterium]
MDKRDYWLDLFTGVTWQQFQDAGAAVSGFRASRKVHAEKIKPGDYLLCYLTGVSRFVGVLEVLSPVFEDTTPIWADEDFPCRLKVKVVAALTPDTAVPVHHLSDRLSFFQNMKAPSSWTGRFRGSPCKWNRQDGEAVLRAVEDAVRNPVLRPVDPAKLTRRPKTLKAAIGPVTVPDGESGVEEHAAREPREHGEIQWLLLKLGNDMGLDVWVARNDRGRQVNGRKFADLPRIKKELPLQFDEATNKTIEHIDVLWLHGNAIVAAFEIESTTSIYSGLLRMSDLVAMQPNLNIPLYLVAPEERRDKVITEVNRPTFSRLRPPLAQMCRFLSFSSLRASASEIATVVRHLKPEFLTEISESCEADEL